MYTCWVKWIVLAHTVQHWLLQLSAKFDGNLWTIFKVLGKNIWLICLWTRCISYYKMSVSCCCSNQSCRMSLYWDSQYTEVCQPSKEDCQQTSCKWGKHYHVECDFIGTLWNCSAAFFVFILLVHKNYPAIFKCLLETLCGLLDDRGKLGSGHIWFRISKKIYH